MGGQMKNINWNMLFIKFFIIANIIDAHGSLKIKYLSSLLLIAAIFCGKKVRLGKSEILLFVIFPIWLVIYSFAICDISLGAAISSVTFCLTVIYYLAIEKDKNIQDGMMKFFVKVMQIIACIVIVIFFSALFLYFLEKSEIYFKVGFYLQNNLRMGYFGYNYVGSLLMPIVYLKSSMFFIFALAGACYYEKKFSIIVLFLVNMIVSTTANIVFAFAIILYYFIKKTGLHMKRTIICCIFSCVSGGFLIILLYWDKLYLKLYGFISDITMQSGSSQAKIGHIISIVEIMLNDIQKLLFGMGGGSSFYSGYLGYTVSNSEVSQLECLRRFGIIYSALFFGYIFLIIYNMYKANQKMLSWGLFMLFIATASNPQLMSPMFLIVLFMCKKMYGENKGRCVKYSSGG